MVAALLAVSLAACVASSRTPSPPGPVVAERKKPATVPWVPGRAFDRVAARLRGSFYDRAFRRTRLPALIKEFRGGARLAATPAEERAVIWRFLSRIPATHLGLLSRSAYNALINEVQGNSHPTLGLQLLRLEDRYFATMVLSGGPADLAGIRPWDEIVAVDAQSPAESPRLDWRSDDAYLGDERDPPTYGILADAADSVDFTVAGEPGRTRDVWVTATLYSGLRASTHSLRVFERDGVRIGYVHWWYMHSRGVPDMFTKALDGPLKTSHALVLDLRGRGGSGRLVSQLIGMLARGPAQRYDGPVVALIDRQTRSAKEMFAVELRAQRLGRLVGEPTAGAVVGAGFDEVGDSAILMFPSAAAPPYTERLELKPTAPDVAVAWGGPYSGARDPILEAGIDEAVRSVHEQGHGARLPLPPLDEIVSAMIEAYGGEAALRRHRTLSASGTARVLETPIVGVYRIEAAAPSRFAATMELDGAHGLTQHADTGDVWVTVSGSDARVTPSEAGSNLLRWQALFHGPLQLRDAFPDARVDGSDVFDGRRCVRLRLGETKNAPILFVENGTFLPLGLQSVTDRSTGVARATMYFRSYRRIDGVMIPDVTVVDVDGEQTEFRLERIDLR